MVANVRLEFIQDSSQGSGLGFRVRCWNKRQAGVKCMCEGRREGVSGEGAGGLAWQCLIKTSQEIGWQACGAVTVVLATGCQPRPCVGGSANGGVISSLVQRATNTHTHTHTHTQFLPLMNYDNSNHVIYFKKIPTSLEETKRGKARLTHSYEYTITSLPSILI